MNWSSSGHEPSGPDFKGMKGLYFDSWYFSLSLLRCKRFFSSKKFLCNMSMESEVVEPKHWDMPGILLRFLCLITGLVFWVYGLVPCALQCMTIYDNAEGLEHLTKAHRKLASLLETNAKHSSGRVLSIIGWDPSVCKSNRLHIDNFRFFYINWRYIP